MLGAVSEYTNLCCSVDWVHRICHVCHDMIVTVEVHIYIVLVDKAVQLQYMVAVHTDIHTYTHACT